MLFLRDVITGNFCLEEMTAPQAEILMTAICRIVEDLDPVQQPLFRRVLLDMERKYSIGRQPADRQ